MEHPEKDDLSGYDGRMVQVVDTGGRKFTGIAEEQSNDYCFHEYGRDEQVVPQQQEGQQETQEPQDNIWNG